MLLTSLVLALVQKRDSLIDIIYPSQIKHYQVEQCHVPSITPTPLCEKTYVSALIGTQVVPGQPIPSPYTGYAYFCVFKGDKYTKVKGVWIHTVIYSKVSYKVSIPLIKNVIEIRLYIGVKGKRGLPVANLINPLKPGNTKSRYFDHIYLALQRLAQ